MGLFNLSTSLSGMNTASARLAVSAGSVARSNLNSESSETDYAKEFVVQKVEQVAFEANVRAANEQLDMLGQLLDIRV